MPDNVSVPVPDLTIEPVPEMTPENSDDEVPDVSAADPRVIEPEPPIDLTVSLKSARSRVPDAPIETPELSDNTFVEPRRIVPAEMVVDPEFVFDPDNRSTPAPNLVTSALPVITPP